MTKTELNSIFKECQQDLRNIDIPISRNINPNLGVNGRALSRWGKCTKEVSAVTVTHRYTIEVSKRLATHDTLPGLKETIYHELLHTVEGCMNHGQKWKSYAKRVYRMLGVEITTKSSAASKGITDEQLEATFKYAVQCQSCGNTVRKNRMANVIKYPDWFLCKCGGKLKRIR